MREETEFRPKPMVEIGGKPVIWHIMKILSGHGIKDFIVCTGYKSEMISSYFLSYHIDSVPFTTNLGSGKLTIHGQNDESDWNVTVVNTGALTPTGGRIRQIEHLIPDQNFFVTYGDGIANVDVSSLIEQHLGSGRVATVTAVQPQSRYGVLDIRENSEVSSFREKPQVQDWINIGYFVFKRDIFSLLENETVLELEPFKELSDRGEMGAFKHEGFWEPMDTFREFQHLESLWNSGNAPWKTW
jgi:glucose-1-phosphate cytidylyltransferase